MSRGVKRRVTELERRLRWWGRWFGPAPAKEWDEDSSHGSGGLMQAAINRARVGIAPIVDEPALHGRWTGAGKDRRWEPERWTAKGKPSKGGAPVWNPHPEADEVEVAVLMLHRMHHLRACCLRAHYCLRGGAKFGARWAGEASSLVITVRRYRSELDLGRQWIGGRLGLSDGEADAA